MLSILKVFLFSSVLLSTSYANLHSCISTCVETCLSPITPQPTQTPVVTSPPIISPTNTPAPSNLPPSPLFPDSPEEDYPVDSPDFPAEPPQPSVPRFKMTPSFPLGSCRMGGPSIPYELEVHTYTQNSICFEVKLVNNVSSICATKQLTAQCNDMIRNNNKIVFWYRHVPECGYDLTLGKKSQNAFPWRIRYGKTQVNAGKFRIFAPNASKPHINGDIGLFKWANKQISGIQVEINKSNSFRRARDPTMDKYKICLGYNSKVISIPECISKDSVVKYSFYDPKKSICTVGQMII